MSYSHGVKTVSTTRTLLVSTGAGNNDGVLVQNQGSTPVYLGGPTVTADGTATGGLQVPAGATVTVPSIGGGTADLWAVMATGTAPVAWLQPVWTG